MPASPKLLMNGKPVTPAEAQKAAALVVDAREGRADVAHVFSTQSARDAWARKSKCAEEIARIEKLAARARKYRGTDHSAAMQRQKAVVDRITADLEDLAKRTGLPVGSTKFFQQATGGGHPFEGPVFDPAILWEHINRGGRLFPLLAGTAYPDFTWLLFNDIASSITSTGTITLWVDVWFSGRNITIVGPQNLWPPVTLNLPRFGFNDVASSAVCVF